MLQNHISIHKVSCLFFLFIFAGITANAQVEKRVQPVWWFGESVAANMNTYRGTTQMLNSSLTVPTAFHKGSGVKPYASFLIEYRPDKIWGGILNIAYDNRGGKFKEVMAPCNCPANLSTNLSYVSIEPSLRVAPFSNAFYLFAGPTIGINIAKKFDYTQEKQVDARGDWSDVRSAVISAQAGAGVDIPLSKKSNTTQITLSPFASFQTDLGQSPRTVESWSAYAVRAGIALKFGTRKNSKLTTAVSDPQNTTVYVTDKKVQFSVRAPKVIPANRQVKETFPIRNSVFFNLGSTEVPDRYVKLNHSQAIGFREEQLQQGQPDNLNNGRSTRQLAVYHNILNILGDRLRSNPKSTILLTGASENNPAEGKMMAENIKYYLVTVFDINESRIFTEGRDKPVIPSEKPGGTNELVLLREGDRRVDITSTSPEMLVQIGGVNSPFLRPVLFTAIQQDLLDSHVIFKADGATDLLESWKVDLTDEQGTVQHYGPYMDDQASVPGKIILGKNTQGNYKVVMTGKTKTGKIIQEQSSVSLMKMEDSKQEGLRYSILYDFDQSKSIASYQNFLTDIITPLIPENSIVIIHGHTDIIGEEKYNQKLSYERANGTRQIIEQALVKAGKKGVKFETYGFGEDPGASPFENNLPEERFYNRTVIIDIVPVK